MSKHEPAYSTPPNQNYGNTWATGGLTKRELVAAMAMQGLLANAISGRHRIPELLSTDAIQYADALLAELERTKE